MKKRFSMLILLILLISCSQVKAQYDAMFTNYMWNEMYINPGYTGSRDAISVVGLYRDQWVGIDGAPSTQVLTIHSPFHEKKAGIGFSAMRETIGITKQTYFMGSYAYRVKLGAGKLSMGLSLGVLSKKDYLGEVKTDQPGDVQFNSNSPLLSMPNGSFGLYYYTDKYYIGLSVPRLINNQIVPDVGTFKAKNTFDPKNIHYFLTAGYVFNVSKEIKLKPTILAKTVYAAPIEIDVSLNAFIREFLWAGLAFRSGDAASLLVGVQINPKLRIGYSYDYTITKLQKINSGSHEICVGYDFNFGKSKIVSPRVF
ncbi:MAG: type IX secretion system membrane protein PorP/SprF [Bacteroidetes bacterium]|nr:type IX secretion system membrane protein PorP/SprF [Bacteroidota bacterium]